MFNYIIIGSGFAGSVIAERIATQLDKKVLVIEKRNHIGGNCFDYKDNYSIIIHKYGPHLFHTDHKEVFDYLSNFTDWHIYQHKVVASVEGKKVPIPFNFNSIDMVFPKELSNRLQNKLLETFHYGSKIPILELKKHADPDIQFLANYVYQKIFVNYTAKQWGKKPDEIDPEVTARVPVYVSRDDRYFTDAYQGVPVEGYTKLFERMLGHQNIKLLLNTDFKEIVHVDVVNKKIYFFGHEFKGTLIFTGMIDELFNYTHGVLPYRSLNFDIKTLEKEYFQEVATVNYPNEYDFTRITEFKHIHYSNTEKTTIMYEYPIDYKVDMVPYYPVFTSDAREVYAKYYEMAQSFDNLILVGRLAEYKYYDMDDVVKRSLELFDERIG